MTKCETEDCDNEAGYYSFGEGINICHDCHDYFIDSGMEPELFMELDD